MFFFFIATLIAKIKTDLLKVRVFMLKVLLGEILENQISESTIFHNKSLFLQNNRVRSFCMDF